MTRIEQIDELYNQYKVNENLLNRDYKTNPLKVEGKRNLISKPDREDLKYLYSILGMKAVEIGLIYGGIPACSVLRYVNDYKLPKPEQTENRTTAMDTTRDRYVCYELVENNKIKHIMVKEPKELKTENNQNIKIYIDEFINVYINDNLSVAEMMKYYNMNRSTVMNIVKFLRLKKEPKRVKEIYRKTMKEKYGCENCFQLEEIKQKSLETMKEKYGMKYQNTDEYLQKIRATKLERYGNEKYVNVEKIKETNLKKYGKTNPFKKDNKEYLYSILEGNDPEPLIKYIKDNNYINSRDFADQEGMKYNTINNAIIKFNLHYLYDYNRSALEKQIFDFVSQFGEAKQYYKLKNNQEIDIYFEDKHIGIEVNGDRWHSDKFHDPNYHYNKSVAAKEEGYFVYHLFEWEWRVKKEKIQNQLRNLLGKNERKLYARKCELKEVSQKETKNFLNENHLQGNARQTVSLGLYFENELIAIMTFGKPRYDIKYQWELIRYCSKANVSVCGGASKLFKYFITKYKPESILSYSDIAKTTGKMYEMLGFKYDHRTPPNYVWVRYKTILSRYQCQVKRLKKIGLYEEGKTERQIMEGRGFSRLYDCGNYVWIWKPE